MPYPVVPSHSRRLKMTMSAITTIAIIAEAGINSNILILLVCEANPISTGEDKTFVSPERGGEDLASLF